MHYRIASADAMLTLTTVVQSYEEVLDFPFDYCIVSTKAVPEVMTTPQLLGLLLTERYQHSQPAYVLLQNGLGIEGNLYQALKAREANPIVITCALYITTNITVDGNVSHGSFVCLPLPFLSPLLTPRRRRYPLGYTKKTLPSPRHQNRRSL